jgi:hypothetical protein
MRYYVDPTTPTGRHGAHKTYYSAVGLIHIIKREGGDWINARAQERKAAQDVWDKWKLAPSKTPAERAARGPAPPKPPPVTTMSMAEKAWLKITEDQAMYHLLEMRSSTQHPSFIPDWAWHQIVRLTMLRSKYADADWEDTSQEQPNANDTRWKTIMAAWAGPRSDIAQWWPETVDKQRQAAAAAVCNQIAEATQTQRGVRLPGGIRRNAEFFAAQATKGAEPSAKPEIAGSFFKRVTTASDLRPGANLFWINTVWSKTPKGREIDNSAMVFPIDGVVLPMPFPAGVCRRVGRVG